ncbi:vWA domain-containing protein [Paenibacillus sp. y28]|uniref:vWA domain-containing protein n=1 Tax=Paenibacillus sp. y28 TaxID=3129110 RepID=UPI0030171CD7
MKKRSLGVMGSVGAFGMECGAGTDRESLHLDLQSGIPAKTSGVLRKDEGQTALIRGASLSILPFVQAAVPAGGSRGTGTMLRRLAVILAAILIALAFAGCSSKESGSQLSTAPAPEGTTSKGDTAGGGESKPAAESGSSTGSGESASAAEDSTPASSKSKSKATMDRAGTEPLKERPAANQARAGQLTAGEWNDLAHWDWWQNLMNSKEYARYQTVWGYKPGQRLTVTVRSGGALVADASVTLTDDRQDQVWKARTNNRGQAELFVGMFNDASQQKGKYLLHVDARGNRKTVEAVELGYSTKLEVELDGAGTTPDRLDVMLVVDTTGSMGDELGYLQAELANVIERVAKDNGQQLEIRTSVNVYRDQGDDYVVRSFPFENDISESVAQLRKQSAAGGGDYEEAVEQALADAISGHDWSADARARLLFLVLDAPPHNNQAVKSKLQALTKTAAEQGIRIIPVASSGVNKDTEFLMRFLGIATGGSYVFLTNHSGIGNSHLAPTTGTYQVEFLNDLLVRIINDYARLP